MSCHLHQHRRHDPRRAPHNLSLSPLLIPTCHSSNATIPTPLRRAEQALAVLVDHMIASPPRRAQAHRSRNHRPNLSSPVMPDREVMANREATVDSSTAVVLRHPSTVATVVVAREAATTRRCRHPGAMITEVAIPRRRPSTSRSLAHSLSRQRSVLPPRLLPANKAMVTNSNHLPEAAAVEREWSKRGSDS